MEPDSRLAYELLAEKMRILSNPKRLMIINLLKDKEKTVGEIASDIGIEVQNASQHLRILKAGGIVVTRRNGQAIYYKLENPMAAEFIARIRKTMVDLLEKQRDILHDKQQKQ
jgi:DNA-binding transcriptional ArsR family regulator